jgi:hypothetical protein
MTPIDPPPGLLDKVREATDAVRDAHEFYASHTAAGSIYGCTGCDARFPDRHGHPAHVADLVDRAAWDAVAEGLGLRGRHITDHEIGYFDEDGNAILQYGGTLHQCEDVLARHPNWFHPDAKILVKQWMFLQSSPEGEWRTVGEPHP